MMQHATTRKLYTYWDELRGKRPAPSRFEIEPTGIADLLPETFLLEDSGEDNFRYRLAGTRICDHFAKELRGEDFFASFHESDQNILKPDFKKIRENGAVGLLKIESSGRYGLTAEFEMLVLPLIHTHGRVERCLGSIAGLSLPPTIGQSPLIRNRIIAHKLVWPDGGPRNVAKHAERQLPFAPHMRAARIVKSAHRHFRVYDGGLAQAERKKFDC